MHILLRTSTSETIVNRISQWAEHHELEEFNTVKKRQQKKFKTLLEEKLQHQLAQLSSSVELKTVVNLSSKPLSEDQTKLLSLGLNFALPPSSLPKEDIIARTEQIAGMMKDQGQHLREEVSRCLRKNKLPIKFNLIRQEGVALKKLLNEDDLLIMKSDKGNATVLLDRAVYDNKMMDLLGGEDYAKLKKDPTAKFEKRVKDHLIKIERDGKMPTPLRKKLSPQHSKSPQIYGLPKIHKDNTPLRPIVCTIGSPTYHLAKHLCYILSPLVGNTNSYISNSTHFVNKISALHLDTMDRMISFDVKSLFTMVPIEDSLTIIKDRLSADKELEERTSLSVDDICSLTEMCLRSTYFRFKDDFYEQKDGTAMGSPLSPVIANIFMEDFEQTAITTADLSPKLWLRDTFVLWQHGAEHLDEFLKHLNDLHHRIQFTTEKENNQKIPFLDVLVERRENKLLTDIYRKPTHTNNYLNYRSNHHPKVKMGIVKCLETRAKRICNEEGYRIETNLLRDVFTSIGYPANRIESLLNIRRKTGTTHGEQPTEENKKTLVLPYIPGLSENISTSCRNLDVRITFSSKRTLRTSLSHLKIPTPPMEKVGVVYSIPCECGRTYVGETGRSLKTRLLEHKRAIKIGDPRNAISVHVYETGHRILWDNSVILLTEENLRRRKLRESILIRTTPNCLNTDPGVYLNPTWAAILPNHSSFPSNHNHPAQTHTQTVIP